MAWRRPAAALPVFGLLGYVEPVLLLVEAVLPGEQVKGRDAFARAPIISAPLLAATDRFRPSRFPRWAAKAVGWEKAQAKHAESR